MVGVAREARHIGTEAVTAQPVLDVRDLHVSYAGAVKALRGVTVSVSEREVVAVLGSNGAGKSTLLRALSGTLAAHDGAITEGTIEFAGRALARDDAASIARRGLVQVPEGRRVFGDLTVEENLRAGGLAAPDKAARLRARAWVDELFPILRERAAQRAGLLSGGEQQMLAIGRALMASPQTLLLDEPSLGLAPKIVERVGEVIREINARGVTVVLVEQNATMALAVADRAVVLEVGQASLEGAAVELSQSEAVRERYLGISAQPVTVPRRGPRVAGSASTLEVERLSVRFGGIAALSDVSFAVDPGSLHALIGPNGGGKVDVLERPVGHLRRGRGQCATAIATSRSCARTGSRRSASPARFRTSRCRRGSRCSTTC